MMRWLLTCFVLAVAAPAAAAPFGFPPTDAGRLPIHGPILLPWPARGSTRGTVYPSYDAEAMRGAQYLGRARLGWAGVDLILQMRDEAGLERYAQLVSDPRSLYYRHFLTPDQIGNDFGAAPADYIRAVGYFASYGLGVTGWRQREMLHVEGPQGNLERALSTHLVWYRKNGEVFLGPDAPPRFAVPLAVRGIANLVTFHRMRTHLAIAKPFQPLIGWGAGFLAGESPFRLAAAYDYTGAYNISPSCCKGDGITIGIVGTGPISSADVPFFHQLFHVTGTGSVKQVNVTAVMPCCYSTGLQTPPPVTAPCTGSLPTCNPEDFEAQLDTEQTSSLAPDATILFYLAYNPNECYAPGPCPPGQGVPALGIGETDDELQQIANDDVVDIVTASYGIGEADFAGQSGGLLNSNGSGAEPAIFATLVSEGIAVFYSSGDSGAEGCQPDKIPATADQICATYPSSDVNVVSVGGTNTPIDQSGRLEGLITAWGIATQTGGAGGGAPSGVFQRPSYQPAGSFCATNNQCDSTHRLTPDIALNADPSTGPAETANCGTGPNCAGLGGAVIGAAGGTSASSQDMGAMWALVLSACKQLPACSTATGPHPWRLGNPAPLFYALSQSARNAVFYDIVYGNNAVPLSTGSGYSQLDPGFLAAPGYDLTTGLGAPFARNLIHAITGM
jgi:subtilase family serine protease